MRKMILAAAAICSVAPAIAHDFWVQPRDFVIAGPGAVPVTIYVGHGPARERWGLDNSRVVQFRSFGPDGVIDRMSALTLNGPRYDAMVRFAKPGTYVLAFQSKPSKSDLPFLRFNEYLAEEGLTPIQASRARRGTDKTNGREFYSRRAKAIVQVGAIDRAAIARVTRPLGLSLEIVPERHPHALKPGEKLPVRIFYEGKPLAGALVKLTNLDSDEKPVAKQRTGADGRTLFSVPRSGTWQFNVVWAKPLVGNPAADFQTTFSSLTFGYPVKAR